MGVVRTNQMIKQHWPYSYSRVFALFFKRYSYLYYTDFDRYCDMSYTIEERMKKYK